MHTGSLAPVEDALAAKARIAPEDDAHIGPGLALAARQQLQDGAGVVRPIDVAGPQVGAQQLLAAEHVQRQVAVAVVVAVEKAPFLLAVQPVAGGVEVQHQFIGRGFEAGDELFDQHLVQPPCLISTGERESAMQRAAASIKPSLRSS